MGFAVGHDLRRRPGWTRFAATLAVLLPVLLLCACVAKQSHPLLQYEPAKMTDEGLVRYYYDLGEAIDACERSGQGDATVSVGGGVGTGGWSGVGVSVGQPVSKGCKSDPLRQRRVDTAIEMRKRGIQH
ncbi:hypothetical protein [Paucidesulfovibrio longus]|uniref:hypothetical protein n=1 Tax=Paucidesulfovibrio longus TaxID=889 RepID=UPI0003B3E1F3|nr:hypothetical protein [Paucidesulfovibrio longus]